MFLEIVSGISSATSISGVTLKDLVNSVIGSDNKYIENYVSYLEAKKVLDAPFDKEVKDAVIRSLEEIKQETETLRVNCSSDTGLPIVELTVSMHNFLFPSERQ